MEKSFLLALTFFLLTGFTTNAQTVEIFSNPNTSQNIITGNNSYHVGEMVYENSEIGNANFTTNSAPINRIELNVKAVGASGVFNSFNIYFKEVPASVATLSTGVYDTIGYTRVYSGSLSITDTGWYAVNLQKAFTRTPGKNLQVMFERLDGVSHITSMFTYGSSLGNASSPSAASARRFNGGGAPVIGSTTLTLSAFRAAIRLVYFNYPALYYRSRQSGNWNDTNTWESAVTADFSSGVINPAAATPAYGSAYVVTVQNGNTVTVTANVASPTVTVSTGSSLLVNSGIELKIIP